MSEKITASHLERAAYVYVRQSTMHQVRHHQESQRRQYGLAEHAEKLGFRQVVVIDADLGRSGSGKDERPGFEQLVAAVCRGEVGAVLALEASRLARNNRDWAHLVDFCALTDTVVIDLDGIYDPRLLNDRLLLGLKGTMSEFELGILRQRAQEALRQKIQRGEVLTDVPAGYVRTRDNRCELNPDRQVQAAIRGIFTKFRELGSARQVLLWYHDEKLPLPVAKRSTGGSEIEWRLPVYHAILAVLQNPIYGGAFVYGRTRTRSVVVEGRSRKTRGHAVPRAEWEVLIRDHHPGYISWDEFLWIQAQLEGNAGMHGRMKTGAAKSGPALLAGLLRCARCGRKLFVSYTGIGGRVPRYHCKGAQINHGRAWCIWVGGFRVDRAVVAKVLEALQPVGIEASLRAWEETRHQEDAKSEAVRLAVERARYEAERVRRQYVAVEPENRLVAAELETRWNEALRQVGELETRLESTGRPREELGQVERKRLLELGQDLETLWCHPQASESLKKRILRTVLEEIVVDVTDEPAEVVLWLHWAGGVHTLLRVARNRTGQHRHCTDRKIVELVHDLAKVCDDASSAAILNRLGYRTGAGNSWTEARVKSLRDYHKIPAMDRSEKHSWLTLAGAASALQISASSARRLMRQGLLPGKQVVSSAPWVIERSSLELHEVQAAAKAIREGRRVPPPTVGQSQLRFKSTT